MAEAAVYPLIFLPVFKDYPWGGRNLATRLGREIPDGIIAESWEIAAHPNGSSTVANGPLAGQTLPEVQAAWGEALVGRRNRYALEQGRFPLLIKLLDAHRWLSVQVHPPDAYALAHEGDFGKTEMWVVLHAEVGAELIYGFSQAVSREQFAQAIATGDTERFLHRVPVVAGDVIFVPTGAIHALGPGIIVAEIQQNSDTTYRIYDWGRPRPIHVEQALAVLDFDLIAPGVLQPEAVENGAAATELIGQSRYFRTERIQLAADAVYTGDLNGETFEIWGVMQGEVALAAKQGRNTDGATDAPLTLDAVSWALLPATLGQFQLRARRDSVLLRVLTP